jgi:hypothetical protein
VLEQWRFTFICPSELAPHRACEGKLSSNVRIDERWRENAAEVLAKAAQLAA